MSAYLEAPPPENNFGVQTVWDREFVPSVPAPNSKILLSQPQGAPSLIDTPTIVVTPKSRPPNTIPFKGGSKSSNNQENAIKKPPTVHILKPQQEKSEIPPPSNPDMKTPQQILKEKIFGKEEDKKDKVMGDKTKEDQLALPSDQRRYQHNHFWNTLQNSDSSYEIMVADESTSTTVKPGWQNIIVTSSQVTSPKPRVLHLVRCLKRLDPTFGTHCSYFFRELEAVTGSTLSAPAARVTSAS